MLARAPPSLFWFARYAAVFVWLLEWQSIQRRIPQSASSIMLNKGPGLDSRKA